MPKQKRQKQTALLTAGYTLSREDVCTQAGCTSTQLEYIKVEGLVPAPEQFPHKGREAADYRWHNTTPTRVRRIRATYDAQGSSVDAAFALLMQGLPCPDWAWSRRALHEHIDRVNKLCDSPSASLRTRNARNVTRFASRHGMSELDATALRMLMGTPKVHGEDAMIDAALSGLSFARMHAIIDEVSDDTLASTYHQVVRNAHEGRGLLQVFIRKNFHGHQDEARYALTAGFRFADGFNIVALYIPMQLIAALLRPSDLQVAGKAQRWEDAQPTDQQYRTLTYLLGRGVEANNARQASM